MTPVPPSSWLARRYVVATAIVATLAFGAASCGVEVNQAGMAQRADTGRTPDGDVVGGDTVTSSTATTVPPSTTEVPQSEVKIIGDDGSDINRTIASAIADLQTWWAKVLPDVYDETYDPVAGGFYAVDRDSVSSTLPCAPDDPSLILDNAYYCPADDAVVWDQQSLMPRLARQFGDFTPAVVLAHEWGHAIQARVRFRGPTVIAEQQADCFAGAWVRHVRDDGDTPFRLTTNDVDNALAGFLSLRDAPGSRADEPNAHGSGFDRVGAFQEGFEDGVDRCSEYRDGDPMVFQFPFNQDEVNPTGDLPLHTAGGDPGILESVFTSLDTYWTKEFPDLAGGDAWDPLKDPVAFTENDPPTCGGEKVTIFDLFVCRPDRYVGYVERPMLRDVYNQGGDFAVATLIATKYGIDAEAQLGPLPNPVTAGLRGDCYAGSWAASILPDRVDPDDQEAISLSPGDLDEAVGVLLSFRSQKDRKDEGPGFDRVRAFRIGVIDGAEACAKVKPS